MPDEVLLDDDPLRIDQVVAVARHGARVRFADGYRQRAAAASDLVGRLLDDRQVVYGVTTGFGANVTETISPDDARRLQEHLVVSHAVSVGAPLPEEQVRAVLVVMLAHLGAGRSGTRVETLELVRSLLEQGVTPVVPGAGSLGYLAVEAHIALVLTGRGRATVDGDVLPGAEALRRRGLTPVRLHAKEGLTLVNGVMSITGIAALAVHDAVRASCQADVVAALTFEALRGSTATLDPRVHALRAHPEQSAVAATLRRLLAGSATAARSVHHRVQDPTLLRALPQVHGAVRRSLRDAEVVVVESLASVGDNPVLFPETDEALSTGNFDGTGIGLAMDGLKAATAVLAHHAERRVDRMVNGTLSGLPPFLAARPGLDSGLMIAQYTAAALVLEMRGEVSPATVESIPTSAGQEDPVSNAHLAVQQASRAVDRLRYVLAIELLAAAQAADLLAPVTESSPALRAVRALVREHVPFAEQDRETGQDIERLYALLGTPELTARADAVLAADPGTTG